MKLKTSTKQASYGKKPHVKKGYYPAKLVKITPYADRETGELIEGTYGHQLIFEFEVYAKKDDSSPMMFEEEGKDAVPVVIPKFVYHEYKDKKTKEFQTAITANSAITKLLKALGWEFSEEDVELDDLLENWVEVNINDFEQKAKGDGDKYIASTIANVEPLAEEESNATPGEKAEPKETASNVDIEDPEVLKAKINDLNNLHKDKNLTDAGHKQAVEQLQAKLDSLSK